MKIDEEYMMNSDDFKLLRGLSDWRAERQTDICECKVAFGTKNLWRRKSTMTQCICHLKILNSFTTF